MKFRLIILRHGKSDWHAGAATDHARPLNKRGRRDAPRVAAKLAELGWRPSHVWSSDATRTRETYELMAPVFDAAPDARFEPNLYLADLGAIRRVVAEVDDETLRSCTTAMFVGHNPGWEEAASTLTGIDTTLTTCNAVLMTVKADSWAAALERENDWKLVAHILPRALR
ncbi:MAG: histidine phosphatase family protein [Myxococcota bacterium]